VHRKVQGFPTGLTKYMDISINNVTSIDDVKNSLVNYGSIAVGVASSYINDPTNIEAFNKGKDLPQVCPPMFSPGPLQQLMISTHTCLVTSKSA